MTDDPSELPHGDEFEPDTPAAAMRRLQDRFRAIHPQAAEIISTLSLVKLRLLAGVVKLSHPRDHPRI
jgi:hypothetical protein